MSNSIKPVSEYEPFLRLLATLGTRPILGIVVGALFTVLVHSSSAMTGLVIAFRGKG